MEKLEKQEHQGLQESMDLISAMNGKWMLEQTDAGVNIADRRREIEKRQVQYIAGVEIPQ